MKVIKSYFEFIDAVDGEKILKKLEVCGRTCYKSEALTTEDSASAFVTGIIKRGHESVLEHQSITVRIICDRGVTHEIVRHRIASYSQESTRYCNYSKDKFGNELTFIKPIFWKDDDPKYIAWKNDMDHVENVYLLSMIDDGASAQEARSVLPNSLKTEIIVTMNLREWRHFFKLRAEKAAHPQMREIAIPMLKAFRSLLPEIFGDIEYDEEFEKTYDLYECPMNPAN